LFDRGEEGIHVHQCDGAGPSWWEEVACLVRVIHVL